MRILLALGLLPVLLGACGGLVARSPGEQRDALAVEPAAGPATGAAFGDVAALPWPDRSSCDGLVHQLVAVEAASASRLDPATSPLGLASLAAPAVELRADLPIPQVAPAGLGAFDCAVVLGGAAALSATADRVLDQRTVHSAYRTGTKRRRNPEHQELEKALAATRRGSSDDADILKTGDPLLDLIGTVAGGIIGGIGAVSTNREVRSLEVALDATPPYIEDPIVTPYRFELTEIEAERRFALPLALHDRTLGQTWRTSVTLTERRRFALAPGRHADDVEQLLAADASLTTPAALTAWRQTVPALTTRTMLTHLEAALTNEPETATLATTIAALGAPADGAMMARAPDTFQDGGPLPAALLASVDAIIGSPEPAAGPSASIDGGGTGVQSRRTADLLAVGTDGIAGFYVTPEHIVVPAEALGHSSLVVVRYPDGLRAHGLVEVVDDALGLALVYLPRRGEPLPRQPVASPAPPATGAPGTPWRIDGRVSGLFVQNPETATLRWIDAVTLDRFVARLDTL